VISCRGQERRHFAAGVRARANTTIFVGDGVVAPAMPARPLDKSRDRLRLPQGSRLAFSVAQPVSISVSLTSKRSLHFSPDGRLVAFSSDESGATEIYVALSTVVTSKKRVSDGGAWSARWSPDGRELFYLSADGYVMAASIHEAPSLEIGVPERLFSMQGRWPWRDFDVSPEGKRFLAIVPQIIGHEQSLTAVLNWPAQVRR
jgi:WD40 repeat protein